MPRVALNCTQCGEMYEKWPSQVARSRFCSQSCLSAYRRDRVDLKCVVCGSLFETVPSKIGKRQTCSTTCLADFNARSDVLASHKQCPSCGNTKPVNHFSPHPRTRDRRQGTCRSCRRLAMQSYRQTSGYLVWRNSNRERLSAHARHYQHTKRANGGDLSAEDWDTIQEMYGYRCAYCYQQVELQQEHVIPISRGGKHSWDNVVPACGLCNTRKSNRSLLVFLSIYPLGVG